MSDGLERPNTAQWPPIIYLATLVIAWALQHVWPLRGWIPVEASWIGWPLLDLGIGIGIAGLLHFRRIGTSFDPTTPAQALATGGIYRFSRNPMYLGAVAGFVGLGLALRWPWLILIQPLTALALVKLGIEREENYLRFRFGDSYRAYCRRVRRWL